MDDPVALPPDTPPEVAERTKRYAAFIEELHGESDRGCAVLMLCVLEDTLQELFKALVTEGTSKHRLRNLAPRGGWSKMLENAETLGLLSPRQCASFRTLVEVRNRFGHGAHLKLSFDSPEVIALLGGAPPAVPMPSKVASNDDSPRGRFLFEASVLWIVMVFKLPTIRRLDLAGDPPTEGMPGYE